MCLKLSNSGDTLRLLRPNSVWKYISGWVNYLDMVILQEIIERAMGYRGSKSVILSNIAVKEQRVDGSCIGRNLPSFEVNLPWMKAKGILKEKGLFKTRNRKKRVL